MTDAILGTLVEKSISLIQNEFATLSGLRKKIEKIENTLILIRSVLEDAEERQLMNDLYVTVWLQELRDAAHVLDDILDYCSSESFKPTNIMFRREVGQRLQEMMDRLDQITKDKNDFALRGVRERPREVAEWLHTSPIIASPHVYGRDEDKEKVMQFLFGPAQSSYSLYVYAIVGFGGIGKTTLAQLVYNDERVSNHFDLKIWVCVSDNFSVKGILRSIIVSVKETRDFSSLEAMQLKVSELLQNKRYLLVLDDVWKKSQYLEFGLSPEEWDDLRSVLSCGSKGASILVSTRDMDVAQIMGACQTHCLSHLHEDDCWSIFKKHAFGSSREDSPVLAKIGKEIVKKCGGSPLAAKALGNLLHTTSEEKGWLQVLCSPIWTLPNVNAIFPALRLSYHHLSPMLKQCFAFCAIFPKDEEIRKEDLIHLWMANGFISYQENLAVEEVGNMVWNELYKKSFFQDAKINYLSEIASFKMHDLVHDLAQSITMNECIYLEEINSNDLPRNTHHIGFRKGGQKPFNKKAFKKLESLRTLYHLDLLLETNSKLLPTSLRALSTNSSNSLLLGHLTHLRYLELYGSNIKTLPDSIYNLCKLEILKLIGLEHLYCLPKHLIRLTNLRHLVIENCLLLSHMFPNIHMLSDLRTLSVYIVKTETGHSLAELRYLNLGGELSIQGLGNVGSLFEAEDVNLKDKEDLRELSLSWEESDEIKSYPDVGQVLEALQPHPNLKALSIRRYKGLHWPSWMVNNSSILNNLVSLKLFSCQTCQWLPPLGKLQSLKTLELYELKYVEYVDGDECYDGVVLRDFPSLESLTLSGLPNLKRLLKMETRDMFPLLSSVHVFDCPKLELSSIPCVKKLHVRESNNESLYLNDIEDMTFFLECMKNLQSLQSLNISRCRKLRSLSGVLQNLTSLKALTINDCDELESIL